MQGSSVHKVTARRTLDGHHGYAGGVWDSWGVRINEMQDAVESVSSGYAEKFGIERDAVWFMLKLQEELGELTQAFINLKGLSRDRGQSAEEINRSFAGECADVMARVLLLARHEGVDLEAAVSEKWLRWSQTP